MINRYIALPVLFCCFILQVILLKGEYYIIAPAIPLALVGMFLLYLSPQMGLLLLAFVIPFEGLFEGNNLFTGAKLIGIALILVCGVEILFQKVPLSRLKTNLSWPVFALIFVFFLSGIFSDYPSPIAHILRKVITVVSIFYITLLIGKRLNLLHLAHAIALSVSITAAFGLFFGSEDATGRTIGLLEDPNFFALLLVCATPLTIYLVLYDSGKLYRLLWSCVLLVLLVAFIKTMSRSGLLILVATLFLLSLNYLYLLKRLNFSQLLLAVMAMFVVAIASLGFLPDEYRERIASLGAISSGVHSYEDRSLSRRTSYIYVGMKAFKEHPLLGSGPGTFSLQYAESGYASSYTVRPIKAEMYREAHNTYLETLAETGILGILSLLSLLAMGARQYWLVRKHELAQGNRQRANLVTHYAATYMGIIMFFLFLSVLINKYMWIYLAVGTVLYSQMKETE